MSREELTEFYKGKHEKPRFYGYDEDGNLIQKNREGTVIKTISLPVYRSPTFEEYDVMEQKREEELAAASKEFNNAKKRLRELYLVPAKDRSIREILQQNRAVEQADRVLQSVRFPIRAIEKVAKGELPIGTYDLMQPDNKHNNPSQVVILHSRPYTLQNQYVREGKAPTKPLKSVAEIQAAAASRTPAILFSDSSTNDYGFLSLDWTVDLDWNGVIYQSAKQALYAELANKFQDKVSYERLKAAETADDVHYSVKDVPGDSAANEVQWNIHLKSLLKDINLLKFTNYPELALRLLQTKDAKLGAYIPDDNLLGIGISIDNVQSQNPANWSGQNLLGQTLMEIRTYLREKEMAKQAAAAQSAPAPVAPVAPAPAKKPRFRIPVANDATTASNPRALRRTLSEEKKE